MLSDFEAADQDSVRSLVLRGLGEHWGSIDESLNTDLDDIAVSFATGRTVVVRVDDVIVGTGSLIRRDGSTAEIVRMSVDRQWRRGGVGRQIVEALVDTARRWGARRVVLETSAAWLDVIAFYERCGFTVTHYEDGAHGADAWFELVISDP